MDAAKFERLTAPNRLRAGDRGYFGGEGSWLSTGENQCRSDARRDRRRCRAAGRFAREHGLELRFIEYMPLDAGHLWEREKVLFADDILDLLVGDRAVVPMATRIPAPRLSYEFADGGGHVGFIASISRPFCLSCNRIRLTSDGKLRNCLFSLEETDLRPLLRACALLAKSPRPFATVSASKWEGHEINTARFIQPERLMHSIGEQCVTV